MFRLSEYVAQADPHYAPHHFKPYTVSGRNSSVTAKGYTGAAARTGYGSYFGNQERQWQHYEFQRKHQSGPDAQPGTAYVLLARANGTPKAELTAEIGGRGDGAESESLAKVTCPKLPRLRVNKESTPKKIAECVCSPKICV